MPYLKILDHNGNKISAAADYEGASFGTRMSQWMASGSGINELISGTISTLRARARDLRRNNPNADGAVDAFVADLIGTGISPTWQIDNKELKIAIHTLWNDFVAEADYDGTYDFYGLEALVSQGLVESGESIVWMRTQPLDADLAVPLQLQVMEGDHLDESYNAIFPNGNYVYMGIEFSAWGKIVAYWLWEEHPGDKNANTMKARSYERLRVPAEEICHVFRPTRPGQRRGTTWLASSIVKMYEYDQYDDAELVRKKGAAMIGGYIIQPPGEDTPSMPFGPPDKKDAQDRDIVAIEPGMFPKLPPGMDVKFSAPADVGNNYEPFSKEQNRSISKGIGITYEKYTGDYADVNFSSIRAGLLDFQRGCKQKQLHVLAHQLCKPVARAFLTHAVLSDAINIKDYAANKRKYWRIAWRPDAWPWVDPLKDCLAAQAKVRNGFTSRTQIIAEGAGGASSGDAETVDEENRRDNERADGKKLIYDSDPRKTAKSGTAQAAEDETIKQAVSGG